MSLQTQLNARRANFNSQAPQTTKDAYQRGVEAVVRSGVLDQARQQGDAAIDFTLPNARDQPVSLKEYREKGPVVLAWYRGGWCPYCNITLRALQQSLPEIKLEYNGNDSNELPLAAAYVIDQQGLIRYAFLDAEYRHRAEPQQVIEVLHSLRQS